MASSLISILVLVIVLYVVYRLFVRREPYFYMAPGAIQRQPYMTGPVYAYAPKTGVTGGCGCN
jgi:hypothetical protein